MVGSCTVAAAYKQRLYALAVYSRLGYKYDLTRIQYVPTTITTIARHYNLLLYSTHPSPFPFTFARMAFIATASTDADPVRVHHIICGL